MPRVATIILNRNLPKPTDKLYEHLQKYDKDQTDIFVLEAGSDPDNLSKYCTWYAKEPEILKNGLRYSRGIGLMNHTLNTYIFHIKIFKYLIYIKKLFRLT